MLKGKKAILFDLDGTLVDSMWVWKDIDIEFLGNLGYTVPEDLQNKIEGMSFTEVANYFKERFHIPDSVEEIKETWQEMAMEQYSRRVPLKPGLPRFLPYAKALGMRMAVASSNDRKLIEAALTWHGIREYFDCIITSCEVKKGKPFPDVYLEAARRIETDPSECLVFEDIVPGILAGKAAGMTVCAVEDAYSLLQEKEKRETADYYIRSYEEVIADTYEE